ncbi:transporter [Tritrichomonas foetus]|uniref:Lysosomal dipeptide transporter MFSD1 n=1 Tax=Tritrichomonas foetus TaxID=1144522 RepID=A0A1J4KVW0_9EUKA|nr:transporter [Tritrichomonas foetus]|eukprot:OHT15024.1 transporter [Tritrichomonas foetus]
MIGESINDAPLAPSEVDTETFGSIPNTQNEKKCGCCKSFKCRRIIVFLVLGMTHNLVFFQRAIPSVLSEMMASTYGVDVAQLGIFSSMFFYPYSFIQPFAGLLADVVEPGFLCTAATLASATGALICGLSKSLFVGCIGRLLVGFGSAPIYASACRCFANWVNLKYYSRCVGAFIAFAGMGSFIAQGPFSILANYMPWQYVFYLISMLGYLFAILIAVFVRGNPVKLGFSAVNNECAVDNTGISARAKMIQLWNNLKTVMSFGSFWWVAAYNFLSSGPFYTIQGMWGGPYLRDVLNFSVTLTGNVVMATSIGNLFGAVVMTQISELCPKLKKKWFIFIFTVISAVIIMPFIFINNMNPILIFILFFIYALSSNAVTNVAYPMVREYYHASVSATAVGCINFFPFAASAIFQVAIGGLIEYYKDGDTGKYTAEGYRNVMWIPTVVLAFIASGCIGLAKDSTDVNKEKTESLLLTSDYQSIGEKNELLS